MKKATCLTDDQRWQSVLARDPNADGENEFAVGVRVAGQDRLPALIVS